MTLPGSLHCKDARAKQPKQETAERPTQILPVFHHQDKHNLKMRTMNLADAIS